jgi:hypothetical protein
MPQRVHAIRPRWLDPSCRKRGLPDVRVEIATIQRLTLALYSSNEALVGSPPGLSQGRVISTEQSAPGRDRTDAG